MARGYATLSRVAPRSEAVREKKSQVGLVFFVCFLCFVCVLLLFLGGVNAHICVCALVWYFVKRTREKITNACSKEPPCP